MIENSIIPGKNIILFDKAYPSIDFINYLDLKDIKYFMRIKANLFEEIKNVDSFGKMVEIIITRDRAEALKRRGLNYKIGTTIRFRVFKFIIDGEEEIVITNLDKNELSYKEALQLFHRRWGIEVKFNELKNRFEIENISGEKVQTIEQDFYASILLCNIAALVSNEANDKVTENNLNKNLKYNYQINKNILLGKLKDNLIEILTQESPLMASKLYNRLINEIQKNVVPIIKGRKFKKKKKSYANKYSKSYRRAL